MFEFCGNQQSFFDICGYIPRRLTHKFPVIGYIPQTDLVMRHSSLRKEIPPFLETLSELKDNNGNVRRLEAAQLFN